MPRRPSVASEFTGMSEDPMRQLEMTVLTQIRDNMSLMAQDLRKQSDKIESVNSNVISLIAARYDEQIMEAKRQFENYVIELKLRIDKHEADNKQTAQDQEVRIRDHDRMISKIGLGMTIAASVSGTALGAVVVFIIQQVLK